MTDPLHHIVRDDRYSKLSVHDLKVMRANMIKAGQWVKGNFAAALVQYWIMKKEGRSING